MKVLLILVVALALVQARPESGKVKFLEREFVSI